MIMFSLPKSTSLNAYKAKALPKQDLISFLLPVLPFDAPPLVTGRRIMVVVVALGHLRLAPTTVTSG